MQKLALLWVLAVGLSACDAKPDVQKPDETAPVSVEETQPTQIETPPETVTEAVYPKPDKQPNFGPQYGSIEFVDTDPGPTIGGTLTMGRAIGADGARLDETTEGISTYMVHWGLEVGAPGTADDKGAGDHGGDCRGFRDTGHVVMRKTADLGSSDTISWEIPQGTPVPEGAVYFVGHTLYGKIHNLGKCTQTVIDNKIED